MKIVYIKREGCGIDATQWIRFMKVKNPFQQILKSNLPALNDKAHCRQIW